MNRKELISRVAFALREKDIKKPVSIKKHRLHISDDDGNVKDFVLKETNKKVLFTTEDVASIIDTTVEVILDAVQRGEDITMKGFGALTLRYTKFGPKKDIETGEDVYIPPRYVAKFSPGADMKRRARIYSQIMQEKEAIADAHTEILASMGADVDPDDEEGVV